MISTLRSIILIGPGLVAMCLPSWSQGQWENQGELQPVEIEIVKERQISLPKATRHFEKIPPRPFEPVEPRISYELKVLDFSTPLASPAVRPLRLKQEVQESLYGGYLSAGFGSYSTPFFDLLVNTKKDDRKLVGARAFLRNSGRGPVDGRNSGAGHYGFGLFANGYTDDITAGLNFNFENRSTHFYGYPRGLEVDRDTIRQSFTLLTLSGTLANARTNALDYELGARLNYSQDRFKARETEAELSFVGNYKLADQSRINLNSTYSISGHQDEIISQKSRSLFRVSPSYMFTSEQGLHIKVGISSAFENDTIDSRSVHLYPDVAVTYPLGNHVSLSGALTGGVDKVTFRNLIDENHWLAPDPLLFHTNRMFDLSGKLDVKLGARFAASAGFVVQELKNLYFFLNDSLDASRFSILYDDGLTKRSDFFASLSFVHGETFAWTARGDVIGYQTDKVAEAWHRPTYTLSSFMRYNLYKKIIFDFNARLLGGMKAWDSLADAVVDLDPAIDLGLKVTYRFSDRFGAFITLQNLLGNNYPLYLNYPAKGFQVEAGLSVSF